MSDYDDQPEMRWQFTAPAGTYFVDLWRGPFRSRIVVWKDVRPALGGLIRQMRCRNRDAREVYDELVETVRTTLNA